MDWWSRRWNNTKKRTLLNSSDEIPFEAAHSSSRVSPQWISSHQCIQCSLTVGNVIVPDINHWHTAVRSQIGHQPGEYDFKWNAKAPCRNGGAGGQHHSTDPFDWAQHESTHSNQNLLHTKISVSHPAIRVESTRNNSKRPMKKEK